MLEHVDYTVLRPFMYLDQQDANLVASDSEDMIISFGNVINVVVI